MGCSDIFSEGVVIYYVSVVMGCGDILSECGYGVW